MKSTKNTLPGLVATASGVGAMGSVAVAAIYFGHLAEGLTPALAIFLGAVPICTAMGAAFLVHSRTVSPLQSKLKNSLELGQRFLPSDFEQPVAGKTPEDEIAQLDKTLQTLGEQIRETKKREKSVIDNAADVICVIDINSMILQVNNASKSVWGYKPEEITGRSLSDFLDPKDVDNTLKNVLGAENSIDRIFFENRFVKKSGEIVDLLWSAHWSVSDGGLFCVAHDITQRKRAEHLLRESEERVRGILENLPSGVLVINKSGLIEFINDTGTAISGHDHQKIKGIRASEVLAFCKEPFTTKHLDELIQNNTSGFDSQIMKVNGERCPAEISLSRFQLAGEKCYLVIFLDVTSKHAIEIAKREFVTMVSHDLRTPLTSINSILSYLEAGHGGQLNEKGGQLTTRARKESERLIVLIRDLLDLEKMKSGKFSMHFAKTSAKEIVAAAVEAVERYADLHKVKISANIAENLICYCDGARVIQVLVNLMDNAIKFSPADEKVIVSAQIEDDELQISVSNRGREIPRDKLQSIFERFEQVEESDAKEKKGTGLGLAICKTIIEQHSGKMWVTSSAKEGSSFSFTLPTKERESDD